MKRPISGLLPPIPTPFDEREQVAYDRFRSNIERWNRCGYSGYVVIGSNGEFVHLTESERWKVIETAREAIPGDMLLIAGASYNATREAVEFARRAASLRADALLVGTPHYYRDQITSVVLLDHYRRIADASPIPILLYNVPQFTGVAIAPEIVARLAEHPNIIGIKDSGGNLAVLAEILRLVPSDFNVLTGSAALLHAAMALGAKGGILAVGCIAAKMCLEIMRLAREGDAARAADLQLRLLPVARAVTTQFGISGLKAALDLLGFYGGPPRAPLPVPDEKMRAEIRAILRASGLFPELEDAGAHAVP
ncbi:MAG: dihydrodipicolinate synthase family protein [Blastocatellia bacterium]|nr:dihydrodipicolinate synthase family protein [Blastocatellia bacterium]MCS7156859.1 dihydrodipicolinate synthase family protein [Blastocatellia bacterium]MCX7752817.1 dihydrodipicolinate synthase family protein [Blastocatellia bacterium]MDW8167551.1 dihydrodipicolinate synthase family protein [Acidobacteriota bacterium]MDW8256151.1 dihydrodipicolinate synthase family protein [Acidobacteriota bacterium]